MNSQDKSAFTDISTSSSSNSMSGMQQSTTNFFEVDDLLETDRVCNSCAPISHGMPAQVVILVDKKPIALDTILPLLFELRIEQPQLQIIWLIKNNNYLKDIRQNYTLWEGMKNTGSVSVLTGPGLIGRLRLISWLVKFHCQKTLLLNHGDFFSSPVDLLAAAVHRGGGCLVGYARWCYPMSRPRLIGIINNQKLKSGAREYYRNSGDMWLLPHPLQAHQLKGMVNSPFVVTGTPRCFPVWHTFLDTCLKENGITDLSGKQIDYANKTILTIFYPGNYALPDLTCETACRDQLITILKAISACTSNILVLIKPHTICDLDELQADISVFSHLDIRITFSHPQILARVTKLTFFTNGSNVMDDMYAAGVPVIDTALYQDWVLDMGGSQFPNKARIAAINQESIQSAILQVLNNANCLPRAELSHLVYPKAKSISACLWGNTVDIKTNEN